MADPQPTFEAFYCSCCGVVYRQMSPIVDILAEHRAFHDVEPIRLTNKPLVRFAHASLFSLRWCIGPYVID